MECRPLDVTLISATDLKDVNLLSKMDVYAVASLSGDSSVAKTKQRTPVDKDSGPNPKWNHTVRFTVPEAPAKQGQIYLKIKLVSDRSFGDKEIGEVKIPIRELIESHGAGGTEKRVSYSVRLPSGKAKGTLDLAFKLGEKFTAPAPEIPKAVAATPVMAYPPPGQAGPSHAYPPPGAYGYAPPPQPGHGYGYAPPPAGHGYAPPPTAGYGYAPPPPGYGYAVAPPQKPKKNRGNMALGLGAGLLGGLLIGDMVSDVGAYDAGYDTGFGDGFDF